MVEQQLLPYFQWLLTGGENSIGALVSFAFVFLGVAMAALVIGFAIAASRYGLLRGGDVTYKTISEGLSELVQTSPRRVWAIARLAIKESMRRRVAVALGVFFLVLLFANWFLSTNHQEPARLYLSFVLTASTYLVLGVALLLSAFSLPGDFKTKTIYTVVTKPVRAGEIILGRIIGFTIVITVLLAIMGVGSYIFVVRSLDHSHNVEAESFQVVASSTGEETGKKGTTTRDAGHRHEFTLDAEGKRRDGRRKRPYSFHRVDRREQVTASRRRWDSSAPACRNTASCGLSTARAPRRTPASALAASGPTAASSTATRRQPRSGRSTT